VALLDVDGVVKAYGGLRAVDGLTFSVDEGEIFGIAGPNGAGKTTLFDVITGMVRSTSGVIRFDGTEIQQLTVHRICHLGIARTFQVPSVFDTQTVLANVVAGAHFGSVRPMWSSLRLRGDVGQRARDELDFVGLGHRAGDLAGPLAVFDKKRLMIASALASQPKMLFLDEPFGGLTDSEVDSLMRLIRRIRERSVTIVLIEHVMRALTALAERVLIMNQGQFLFQGPPERMLEDPEVVRVYLGESHAGKKR
jgi:branched-chain amino acid transport system ATP-binding protein